MDTCKDVDALASKMAGADGLDFTEPCGLEKDEDYCDSDTCIAANYEDHDADYARNTYRRYARVAIKHFREVAA